MLKWQLAALDLHEIHYDSDMLTGCLLSLATSIGLCICSWRSGKKGELTHLFWQPWLSWTVYLVWTHSSSDPFYCRSSNVTSTAVIMCLSFPHCRRLSMSWKLMSRQIDLSILFENPLSETHQMVRFSSFINVFYLSSLVWLSISQFYPSFKLSWPCLCCLCPGTSIASPLFNW